MEAVAAGFNNIEIFFLICAIAGGILVIFRFILMFMGGDIDTHGDMELDLDIDSAAADVTDVGEYHDAHIDADKSFRLISLHGLSAFFMMFGLLGLALYRASHLTEFAAIGGAIVGALVTVWLIGKIFGVFIRFQSSGTLNVRNAIGCEGSVYLTIPKDGIGRVMADINGRQIELDARSSDGAEIPTGEAVKVVGVTANVLTVEKL